MLGGLTGSKKAGKEITDENKEKENRIVIWKEWKKRNDYNLKCDICGKNYARKKLGENIGKHL